VRSAGTVLAGLALLATAATGLSAHTGGRNGYAAIVIDGMGVRYALTLWPASMPPEMAETFQLARSGPGPERTHVLSWVRDRVAVVAQGRRCDAGPGSVSDPPSPAESVILVVDYACGIEVRDLAIRDDLPDVLGADYHTLARIDAAGVTSQFAFGTETREARMSLDERGRGAASFVRLGVEHILAGWDHLLFLLALVLRGGGWLSLAKIITAFTVAHSLTLTLAALDIVAMPDRLVEAVIALSIAAVAAENLFHHPVLSRRWLVSFGFGLVHGFGFSSVLREIGLPTRGLVTALLGFNVGVELGQALVLAVTLPLLALLRNVGWEPRLVRSASLAILLVGAVLFVERTFF
jgi:HupE/UreJ protein